MLENPTDENVVRWGNDGDSFVVLEVRRGTDHGSHAGRWPNARTKNSRNTSCPSTSSTATSPVSCASWTSTTSTKCDTTMKKMGSRRTGLG